MVTDAPGESASYFHPDDEIQAEEGVRPLALQAWAKLLYTSSHRRGTCDASHLPGFLRYLRRIHGKAVLDSCRKRSSPLKPCQFTNAATDAE